MRHMLPLKSQGLSLFMSDGPFYGIQRDCEFIEEKYKVKIRKT